LSRWCSPVVLSSTSTSTGSCQATAWRSRPTNVTNPSASSAISNSGVSRCCTMLVRAPWGSELGSVDLIKLTYLYYNSPNYQL
ncbi:hypothetical protein BAE44_0010089, partial [Dichanthelium oligosanthes]